MLLMVDFLSDLLTARVEGLLQLAACFWNEALLHGGKVVRVLQGDFQLVSVRLQRAQEVLREATCSHMVPRVSAESEPARGDARERNSPSCSRLKLRLVVSSFRFLLKSMHRLLNFFLMVLIS